MAERIPLLLLPGQLCDARLWRDQAAALADIANPVHVDLTLDDSVEAMATRVLSGAPPRFALAALSMGGYVSFEIMRRAPERVIRLALFATSAAPDPPARAQQRRANITSMRYGKFAGVTSRMLRQLVHPDRVATAIGADVRAMAERVGGEAFVRQQAAIVGRPDSRPMLGSINVPTLIVVGDADVLTPREYSEEIHASVVNSRLVVLSHCGHLPPMELPTESSVLLRDWLTSS